MVSKSTSGDARGTGSSAAAPIRRPRTSGEPIPEPSAPRDVPEPLGDLPPENVGRGDGASPNRKDKKIPSDPGDAWTNGSSEASASLQAKVESRSSRANRRKV